jgi:hypothetical protein
MADKSIAQRVQEIAEQVTIDNGLELVHTESRRP